MANKETDDYADDLNSYIKFIEDMIRRGGRIYPTLTLLSDLKNIKLKTDLALASVLAEEKEFVRTFCIGLVHPDQSKQKEFTKWLQDTVMFHLDDFKKKLRGSIAGKVGK
jgi:hypothetical protein